MEQKNELQQIDPTSPNQMIKLAIEGNADLEKLEKLLGLQEQYEANEARKVFASDFAIVQSNIAGVVKTKVNPQTHSKYAGLENVLEMSKPVYTKEGFSIIFYEGETEVTENIRVCADVLHKAGHKETYHFDVPLDGVGIKGNANMTKIHGKASSVSYGRRYLLCMIWNIPTQDDDGNANGKPKDNLPAKPNAEQEKTLFTIQKILEKETGKKVDKDNIAALFLTKAGKYPSKNAAIAAEWLKEHSTESEWAEEKDPKAENSDMLKNMEQAFFNFEMENQPYLADNDGKVEFNKDKFFKAVYKAFGELPTEKSPAEIVEAVKPEDCTIKTGE